jgi:formyltetrahydrofolate hydrolase
MEMELRLLIAERSKLKQQLEDVEAEIQLIIDIHDSLHKVVQQYKMNNNMIKKMKIIRYKQMKEMFVIVRRSQMGVIWYVFLY